MSELKVTTSSGSTNYKLATAKRKTPAALLTEEQLEKLKKIEQNEKNTKRLANQKLDKDAFLKLMTTQLKYQNPLEPMDNKEMVAQMAQFSSVEQLNNMASAMSINNNGNDKIIMKLEDMTAEIKKSNEEIKKLNEEIKKLHGSKDVSGDKDSKDDNSNDKASKTEAS
jgi:flagellar basal-body rod modification protein FlgD